MGPAPHLLQNKSPGSEKGQQGRHRWKRQTETTHIYTRGDPGRGNHGEPSQSLPVEAGCLRPENVAGMLWGGAPGGGGKEVLLRKAPEESPGGAERRQLAKLLGPASSHRPQGSEPNPEISQKVRQSAQDRGH